MGHAFAIQPIFIPILRELPDSKNYKKYLTLTYCIGFVVYLLIALVGAFGTFFLTQQFFLEYLQYMILHLFQRI